MTNVSDEAERGGSALVEVLDFDRYIPTVLSRLVWKFRASADNFFGESYGVSLVEWRIISFIAAEGASSAYAIWTEGNLDKAAVSRALRKLAQRDIVAVGAAQAGGRRKSVVTLTAKGRALHRNTFEEVVARHARLVQGLSAEDIATFFAVLHRLERNIPKMKDGPAVPSGLTITKGGSSEV